LEWQFTFGFSDMPVILFLMYHGQGHLNAVLGLAKSLEKQNHKIILATHEYFRAYASQQQIDFRGLRTVPFGLEFERWSNQVAKKKNIYWNTLKDRWTDRLFHERSRELNGLLEDTTPDVVLIDSWQSTDLVVLYQLLKKKKIRVGFIQTMCISELRHDLPPLNSLASPENVRAIKQSHRRFFWQRLTTAFRQNFYYLGKSNSKVIRRKMAEVGMPSIYKDIRPALFSPSFPCVEELVIANEKFDFESSDKPAFKTYVGLLPHLNRNEIQDEAFEKVFSTITSSSQRPLIYCSMGTVDYKEQNKISRLIRTIVECVKQNNWIGIFSGNFPGQISGQDVYWFRQVPQLRVLEKTAVFITHGGLNSIKEAIYLEVPMIVYPISRDTDQHGNAARVVSGGLGLSGDPSLDTTEDVSQKITQVLSVSDYKEKIRELKKYDLINYPEAHIHKVISNLGELQ
jgi:zeaxanthin glucosyltransferase